MHRRFTQKVAVVTGVSDRGIGGAIAERLAVEGAAVAALFFGERPRRLMKKLDRIGEPVLPVHCDVTDESSVHEAVDAVMAEFGQVDVLINNAGLDKASLLQDQTDHDWSAILDVNLTGAMRMSRACLPYLTEPGGVIVSLSSALAANASAGFGAYSASKAGLTGLTQCMAAELAPTGRRAVCVAPALCHTPMSHQHLGTATEEDMAQIDRAHPLGMGIAADVAGAVAFFASDEARWITGATLPMGHLPQFALPYEAMSGVRASEGEHAPPKLSVLGVN